LEDNHTFYLPIYPTVEVLLVNLYSISVMFVVKKVYQSRKIK